MAKYRPKKIKSGGAVTGIATVSLHASKPLVKVDFEDEEKSVILKKSECPDYVQSGEFMVTVNSEKTKMFGMRPLDGMFVMRTQRFASKENELPKPRVFHGENWDYEYFIVLLEITRGKEKGMITPYSLRYHFGEVEEGGKSVVGINHPKSKYTPELEEYLEVNGVWEFGEMPYKDNVLPAVEKRVLRAAKEFNVLMKGGWVDKVFPLQELKEETLDEKIILPEVMSPDEYDLGLVPDDETPWEDA